MLTVLLSACVPLCSPVHPCVSLCTPVYPADPFVHLCVLYPCVCTVPLCAPVYPCDPPEKKSPPPQYLSSGVPPRATPTSDVYPPPNVRRIRRAFRGTAHIGCLGACALLRGGGRVRGTWSLGDAWRLRGSGFGKKRVTWRLLPITWFNLVSTVGN